MASDAAHDLMIPAEVDEMLRYARGKAVRLARTFVFEGDAPICSEEGNDREACKHITALRQILQDAAYFDQIVRSMEYFDGKPRSEKFTETIRGKVDPVAALAAELLRLHERFRQGVHDLAKSAPQQNRPHLRSCLDRGDIDALIGEIREVMVRGSKGNPDNEH